MNQRFEMRCIPLILEMLLETYGIIVNALKKVYGGLKLMFHILDGNQFQMMKYHGNRLTMNFGNFLFGLHLVYYTRNQVLYNRAVCFCGYI